VIINWFKRLKITYKIIVLLFIILGITGTFVVFEDVVFDSLRDIDMSYQETEKSLPAPSFLLFPTILIIGVLSWMKNRNKKKIQII
jgi:hypothetical protein